MRINQSLLAIRKDKDWKVSEAYLKESLELREKFDPIRAYEVLHNLGYMYYSQGKTDDALFYYNKALSKASRIDNKINTILNISNIEYDKGNTTKALSLYEEALNLLAKIDSPDIYWENSSRNRTC